MNRKNKIADPLRRLVELNGIEPSTSSLRSRKGSIGISRDATLEPLDVRVAIELIDKLASGHITVASSQRGYAGVTCAIVLGATARACDDHAR